MYSAECGGKWSRAHGVAHVGHVGHDKHSLASVAIAGFARTENSNLNAVSHSLQWRNEGSELPVDVPRDVLAEDAERPALIDNTDDLIDEESIIEDPEPLSCNAVALAGISGSDAMNASTPRSSVEGGKVRPDRRRSQVVRFHAVDQLRWRPRLPSPRKRHHALRAWQAQFRGRALRLRRRVR